MNIGLIDADLIDRGTRHPNLAIMKLARYHINKGDKVMLIIDSYESIKNFDKVYISKVFNFTKVPDWVLEQNFVNIGGTGFFEDGGPDLPYEIEHSMPYYDIYNEFVEKELKKGNKHFRYDDYKKYSIGFATRGCFRKCVFCVNKKYDRVQRHSHINEFLDESRPKIYLWDDNILAYPKWEEVLDELEETNKPFQFRQGIDLRLMTEKMAFRFNRIKWTGDFIFALDHIKDTDLIVEKLQLWRRFNNRIPKLYVIVGFASQDEKDIEGAFHRISTIMKYGSLPYIMRHEDNKLSPYKGMYTQLARWCNQPRFFKKKSFRQFCETNQDYKVDKSTLCASMKEMIKFENDFPNIAKQYYDLRFDTNNYYLDSLGLYKKYYNKRMCYKCKINKFNFKYLIENDTNTLIKLYLSKEIHLQCLQYSNAECQLNQSGVAKKIYSKIDRTTTKKLVSIFKDYKEINSEKTEEVLIPFSSLNEIIESFNKVKSLINKKELIVNTKELRAYGLTKNIISFLTNLDLIYCKHNNRNYHIGLTEFGKLFNYKKYRLEIIMKKLIFGNLLFRIYYYDEERAVELVDLTSKTKFDRIRYSSNLSSLKSEILESLK